MFSKNTNEVNKRKFMSALDIRSEARTEKYLGLPIYMGKSKSKSLSNSLRQQLFLPSLNCPNSFFEIDKGPVGTKAQDWG